jgi:hypothetical protein
MKSHKAHSHSHNLPTSVYVVMVASILANAVVTYIILFYFL